MSGSPPSFPSRYLTGELAEFFQLPPGDTAAALALPRDRPRGPLTAALKEDARRLGAPSQALAAIDRLDHPESRVVVTGQQSGLLLGPAYTISKAVAACSLARRLDTEERPVVPVFWVASQDHDTAEVDHAHLLDLDERLHHLRLELPTDVPSGFIPFNAEWLRELEEALSAIRAVPEHAGAVLELIGRASSVAESFADHFSALLYSLLGRHGLVVLDPTRPPIAPLFSPVLEAEIDDPLASTEAIRSAARELSRLGLEPQLGRGNEATNLFLLEREGDAWRRRLLRFGGGKFGTDAASYNRTDLRAILQAEPFRLSPAAGLRPVTQDALLPSAAFVVGQGELRYLAQLRGVYERHGVAMPLVWPRSSSVVLEPPVRRILARYGLGYGDYERGRGELARQVVLERAGHEERFERAARVIESECGQLLESVAAIDPTLTGTVERSHERISGVLRLLREKAAAALLREDETTARQFERLETQLFPGGVAQERYLSPLSFLLKFGIEPMLDLYLTMGPSGQYLLEP